MSEKVKSFKNFLNESDRIDLPSPDEVRGLSVFKEMERIFPTLERTLNDPASVKRYFENNYRWEKFKYYIKNYSATLELGMLP